MEKLSDECDTRTASYAATYTEDELEDMLVMEDRETEGHQLDCVLVSNR